MGVLLRGRVGHERPVCARDSKTRGEFEFWAGLCGKLRRRPQLKTRSPTWRCAMDWPGFAKRLLLADGQITARETALLKRALLTDGSLNREEVEFLVDLKRT